MEIKHLRSVHCGAPIRKEGRAVRNEDRKY